MSIIRFGEWLPDQPAFLNPGITHLRNALPNAIGYGPVKSAQAYSAALDAHCRGGIYARDKDRNSYVYAGSETKIQSLSAAAWTDVTRSGDPYACTSGDRWEFAQFDETIIGTNFTDEIQSITLGSANFADLGGTPPRARHIAVSKGFVLVANVNESGTNYPSRVRWCALGDPTDWTPSAVTQSDYEDLRGKGGNINATVGGDYVTVLQRNAIWRMTYIGAPAVWDFDEVESGVGLLTRGAWAQVGPDIYYLSERGFMVLRAGSRSEPIGWQKVDNFMLDDLDYDSLHRVTCIADTREHRVFWSYPSASSVAGEPNKMIVYDYALSRWGYVEQPCQAIVRAGATGYTLDTLDTVSTDIDTLSPSLDDIAWTGDGAQLAFFDGDNKLAFLSGAAMDAEFTTAELQFTPGKRSLLSASRPLVDGGSQSVEIGYRDLQTEQVAWLPSKAVNGRGRATQRKNARYHRLRTAVTGEWTHAIGIEPEASNMGSR